ncbi:GNAT family N-acetyltransferase [Rhizobium mayense]|uniref:GNAT family N-acetyltransferase n=1 Tax=Rhizobium mayense TaxID=1312184 RepID=UPI003D80A776
MFFSLALRGLRSADVSAFREIRLHALREHPEAFGASWEEERVQPVSRFAERPENGHVIGAISEGEPILGTIGISRSNGQKTQRIESIWAMYMSPTVCGKGLARLLLNAALAEGGPSIASAPRGSTQGSRHSVESTGFKRWAPEAEALKVGDVFHDGILMRLRLRTRRNTRSHRASQHDAPVAIYTAY